MTNKEQIIVDGTNVTECIFLDIVNGKTFCDCATTNIMGKSLCPYTDCLSNLNCYYKQLKQKEQECEPLKVWQEALSRIENLIGCIKETYYETDLDENDKSNLIDYCDEILNIINKAKED